MAINLIQKITPKQISENKVAHLANRPNSPSTFGKGDLSAKDLKESFDKLSLLAIDKINEIIQVMADSTILEALMFSETESLKDAMESGSFARSVMVQGPTSIKSIEQTFDNILQRLSECLKATETATDSEKLGGIPAEEYALKEDVDGLAKDRADIRRTTDNPKVGTIYLEILSETEK